MPADTPVRHLGIAFGCKLHLMLTVAD